MSDNLERFFPRVKIRVHGEAGPIMTFTDSKVMEDLLQVDETWKHGVQVGSKLKFPDGSIGEVVNFGFNYFRLAPGKTGLTTSHAGDDCQDYNCDMEIVITHNGS